MSRTYIHCFAIMHLAKDTQKNIFSLFVVFFFIAATCFRSYTASRNFLRCFHVSSVLYFLLSRLWVQSITKVWRTAVWLFSDTYLFSSFNGRLQFRTISPADTVSDVNVPEYKLGGVLLSDDGCVGISLLPGFVAATRWFWCLDVWGLPVRPWLQRVQV